MKYVQAEAFKLGKYYKRMSCQSKQLFLFNNSVFLVSIDENSRPLIRKYYEKLTVHEKKNKM